jgi:hypothetical protein
MDMYGSPSICSGSTSQSSEFLGPSAGFSYGLPKITVEHRFVDVRDLEQKVRAYQQDPLQYGYENQFLVS